MGARAIRTTAALLSLGASVFVGCTSSSDTGTNNTDPGPASATGAVSGIGTRCNGYQTGKDGVLQTFCGGKGKVVFTANGKTHEVTGVTCTDAGAFIQLNGGIVVAQDFKGTKPDYVGLRLPDQAGDFVNIAFSLTADGKTFALTENSGSGDGRKGMFKGTDFASAQEVTGSYSCD